jgi:hypothetical protein
MAYNKRLEARKLDVAKQGGAIGKSAIPLTLSAFRKDAERRRRLLHADPSS